MACSCRPSQCCRQERVACNCQWPRGGMKTIRSHWRTLCRSRCRAFVARSHCTAPVEVPRCCCKIALDCPNPDIPLSL